MRPSTSWPPSRHEGLPGQSAVVFDSAGHQTGRSSGRAVSVRLNNATAFEFVVPVEAGGPASCVVGCPDMRVIVCTEPAAIGELARVAITSPRCPYPLIGDTYMRPLATLLSLVNTKCDVLATEPPPPWPFFDVNLYPTKGPGRTRSGRRGFIRWRLST
jgi:hypothetical protein